MMNEKMINTDYFKENKKKGNPFGLPFKIYSKN